MLTTDYPLMIGQKHQIEPAPHRDAHPQYYIPVADVVPENVEQLKGRHFADEQSPLFGLVRFHGDALDQWFEEDEQIFVHPRNPDTRVDAVRSSWQVRVELDRIVLAEASSSVMVFETGLLRNTFAFPRCYVPNASEIRNDSRAPGPSSHRREVND